MYNSNYRTTRHYGPILKLLLILYHINWNYLPQALNFRSPCVIYRNACLPHQTWNSFVIRCHVLFNFGSPTMLSIQLWIYKISHMCFFYIHVCCNSTYVQEELINGKFRVSYEDVEVFYNEIRIRANREVEIRYKKYRGPAFIYKYLCIFNIFIRITCFLIF